MIKQQKHLALSIATALMLATTVNASAVETNQPLSQTNHHIGLGVGSLSGALIAGPVGAIIGGVVGALLDSKIKPNNEADAAIAEYVPSASLINSVLPELLAEEESTENNPIEANAVVSVIFEGNESEAANESVPIEETEAQIIANTAAINAEYDAYLIAKTQRERPEINNPTETDRDEYSDYPIDETVNEDRSEHGDDFNDMVIISQGNDFSQHTYQYTQGNNETVQDSQVQTILSQGLLGFDVLFRSGSIGIESHYRPRLAALSALLKSLPNMTLKLDAYSDRIGNIQNNLELSAQRLNTVYDFLIASGVNAERIQANAHGEDKFISKAGELNAYGLDRRVEVSFAPAEAIVAVR